MKNVTLSIIIVNYNTKQLTLDCIQSIIDTVHHIDYEIILMDNSTKSDEQLTGKYLTHHRIFSDDSFIHCYSIPNNGYANANNLGYSHACGDYILLLNPDTLVYENAIEACLETLMAHSDIGAIGCKVLRPDGSLDHACRRGFPTPFSSFCYFGKLNKIFKNSERFCRYTMSHLSDTISCDVDSLTGAFMLMPRHVVEQTQLFDETFFMYGEDLDLCYRIKEFGYRIHYKADVSILHKKYQSGFAKRSPLVIRHFYHSMILFYDKHYRKEYSLLITLAVRLGVSCIMYTKLLLNHLKR